MRFAALVLVACSSTAAPTGPRFEPFPPPPPPPVAVDPPQPALRLPRHFTPTGYVAKLAIDPAKPTFSGEMRTNFAPYVGGKHDADQQIEWMDQCIAQRAVVGPSIQAWLGK